MALTLLEAALVRVKTRIDAGEMNEMNLKELLSEARKMMSAAKGPSTSITAIQIPVSAQLPDPTERHARIAEGAQDPEAIKSLRESAKRYARRQE